MENTAFIGRLKETVLFNQLLTSKQAEFIAVYGRRRVGKTFLIRHAIAQKGILLECSGMKEGSLSEQLANFNQKFSETFYPGLILQPDKSWKKAFERLTVEIKKTPKTKKIIIFLDELPWLASPRSKLLQNLDYFWNTEWSRLSHCKLIVCGSAASWMLTNLIHAKGGLYNRVTQSILLEPFNLKETKQFLESKDIKLNHHHIVELYMVMGGIPFYLNQLKKSLSLTQNIHAICFEKDGLLYSEFPKLFHSLFTSSEQHIKIIKEVAKKRFGITFSELLKKTNNKAGGRFKKYLDELEACGFIQKYLPYKRKTRDHYYRVTDEYTMFYLTWIQEIHEGKRIPKGIDYWHTLSQSPTGFSWKGLAFEMVVYKHLDQVIRSLKLEKTGCLISPWQYQPAPDSKEDGAQIDLLIDRDDNAITLFEIKYSHKVFVIDKTYAKILLNKMAVFEKEANPRHKQLFLAMITAGGLKQNPWSEELVTNTVEIEDLFN